jgi:hypothetical protein
MDPNYLPGLAVFVTALCGGIAMIILAIQGRRPPKDDPDP